jgi:hypothetical protein
MLFHHFRLRICQISNITYIYPLLLFFTSSDFLFYSFLHSFSSTLLFFDFSYPPFLPLISHPVSLPSILNFSLSSPLNYFLSFFLPSFFSSYLSYPCSDSRGDYHVAAVAHTRNPRCTQTHTRGTTHKHMQQALIHTHTTGPPPHTHGTQHTTITL